MPTTATQEPTMNRNAHRKGQPVVSLDSRTRRLAAGFPGWDSPDYADFLLPIVAGLEGVVTAVSSHGNAPWTRYSVRFEDGSRAADLVPGIDFEWA